ncbi:MAG: Na/Pi cotransporter family protein [Acutalibacteraceae bacterium]|nr:Na/Pi cotransporter family protein [Acutalibacteraceae bacterium]
MNLFDVLSLIGGLALFLFGMQLMGNALEKKAGGQLKNILEKMTDSPFKGFLLGMIVTCVIQSSSATTVMVVGFVNSGIMKLRQAISIIMGANIGTTITAWILSLTGVSGDAWYIQLFKPSSFVPVLALIGVIFYVFLKSHKHKDTGVILLGFATLMTGMQAMSDAVAGLKDVPQFASILTLFTNPILGVLAGAVLTAIIQSSSASVGILQALSSTGAISFGAAVPIIMGQNIGTCATAMLSCIGANKNAKRTAFVHLYFNVIGTIVLLTLFTAAKAILDLSFLDTMMIDEFWIAVVHSAFNVICTVIWFPFTRLLEKLACITVRDTEAKEHYEMLDERLLATPSVAVERCRSVANRMAEISVATIKDSFTLLSDYNPDVYEAVINGENKVDKYEDRLGSYLVKVSSLGLSDDDSLETTKLLHIINDFERISDHSVNILQSAQEIVDKKLEFSGEAKRELSVLMNAVDEIVDLAFNSFVLNDLDSAIQVEPLEEVVDNLKDAIKSRHVARLQKGDCTIELGFILTDLLTNLERVSDHCSNIAGCMLEMAHKDMAIHKYLRSVKDGDKQEFNHYFDYFTMKYDIEKV